MGYWNKHRFKIPFPELEIHVNEVLSYYGVDPNVYDPAKAPGFQIAAYELGHRAGLRHLSENPDDASRVVKYLDWMLFHRGPDLLAHLETLSALRDHISPTKYRAHADYLITQAEQELEYVEVTWREERDRGAAEWETMKEWERLEFLFNHNHIRKSYLAATRTLEALAADR